MVCPRLLVQARGLGELGLQLQALADLVFLDPLGQHGAPFLLGRVKDHLEVLGQAISGIGRLGDRVTGNELVGVGVEEDLLDGADLPQGLQPVVAALAVGLAFAALQDAEVAADMGDGCALAELDAGGEVFVLLTVEAVVDVIQQGEHGIALIDGVAVDFTQHGANAVLGHTLVGGGDGVLSLRDRIVSELFDVVL